jgi:hypothetical protein
MPLESSFVAFVKAQRLESSAAIRRTQENARITDVSFQQGSWRHELVNIGHRSQTSSQDMQDMSP